MRNAAVTAIVGNVLNEIEGLAAERDPLEAELFASGVLALWHAEGLEDPRPYEALGTSILRRLGRRPEPDVLAGLLAIAALAEPPFDEAARAEVERLRAVGVPEPVWSHPIERPTLVDAWISTDELDDQSHVLLAFAHDRRRPHALNLIVDANFSGLIRDAFAADNPEKVRREWVAVSGLPIRALSEQALADILGQGIKMFDTYLDPPVTDEARQLMPLLKARLRLLPTPREIEVPEVTEDDRQALVAAFVGSPEASDLAPIGGEPAANLAAWFVDFACDYGAGDPLRWSPIAIELLLGDWLPRKAILAPGEVEALPNVLRRFVRFSARRKGLPERVIAETLEAVGLFAPEFAEGMADPGRAGPAKEILMGLRAAGIDPTDAPAVQRWIDERNEALRG